MAMQSEPVSEVTESEFNEIVHNGHKLVVVDFFAEWCMPCLMMAPIIDELAEKLKEVKFVKIDVDDNQEIAGKYEVRSIPTMIFFKEGKEVDKTVGGMDQEALEEKIQNLLKD
jgi:thioredoxin 1